MSQTIRFNASHRPDFFVVANTPMPRPAPGEVVVEVVAAALSLRDLVLRRDLLARRKSGASGESGVTGGPADSETVAIGSDLAGIVHEVGAGVRWFRPGDEVLGWVERGSMATEVAVPETQLLRRPVSVPWEIAGSLYVSGTTAWNAINSMQLGPGDTIVITNAAGAVGCLAAQLATARGATVVGTCLEHQFDFVRQFGVIPVVVGPGLANRIRTIGHRVTAVFDVLGGHSALGTELGVSPARTLTVLDHDAVQEHRATLVEPGDATAFARVVQLVARHQLRLPVADIFRFDQVPEAISALERRDASGKIVIGLRPVSRMSERIPTANIKEQDATLAILTPHPHIDVTEAIPPVLGDAHIRRQQAG